MRLRRAAKLAWWSIVLKLPRRLRELTALSKVFDADWYVEAYPDVAAAGANPLAHYLSHGAAEGRDPGPRFSTWRYLQRYPDLKAAGVNPLLHYLEFGFNEGREILSTAAGDYEAWISRHEDLSIERLADMRQSVSGPRAPLISIIVPTYNSTEDPLHEAIESVLAQAYGNWELCIVDDASPNSQIRKILLSFEQADARIKVIYREERGGVSRASNTALEMATGEWVAILRHEDLLAPHALFHVAEAINAAPDVQLIYSDEDMISNTGQRRDPSFKPAFSPELFRSRNYLGHLTVHRMANIRAVGGWRAALEDSQDYDLNLRIVERIDASTIRHIPHVLYHRREISGSTATATDEATGSHAAYFRVLKDHIDRLELPAKVEHVPGLPFYHVRFEPPKPAPLVSIILPTRDRVDLLRMSVGSILARTTYEPFEILIVDNESVQEETKIFLMEIAKDPRIRVLPYPHAFNYSAINNFAAGGARGEILALVNNDIEVISSDWLTEMVAWAAQREIGCVGAKLYYPDDTIQHAGVILGVGGAADHSHKHFPRDHPGYCFRLKLPQTVSAVTGACLVVRKSVFFKVGGLNEGTLVVAFNDIDFCLKVREAGYRNVWTPFAELYHYESSSRGRADTPEKRARALEELAYFKHKWGKALDADPFYSPHLARDRGDFSIRT